MPQLHHGQLRGQLRRDVRPGLQGHPSGHRRGRFALPATYGVDKPYFFNRKEAKDHGEGGSLVGYKPQDGDRVIIIEDVITAGTAVRETVPVLTGRVPR